jgi:hypothetical protein
LQQPLHRRQRHLHRRQKPTREPFAWQHARALDAQRMQLPLRRCDSKRSHRRPAKKKISTVQKTVMMEWQRSLH